MLGPGTSYPLQKKQQAPHDLTLLFQTEASPILLLLGVPGKLGKCLCCMLGQAQSAGQALLPVLFTLPIVPAVPLQCHHNSLYSGASVQATHFSIYFTDS